MSHEASSEPDCAAPITCAPKWEKASGPATALEIDVAQLERLTAAAFELLGKPPGQSHELAKAILKASGAQERTTMP